MNTIRASMLPAWDDCSRRTGARQYGAMLAAHGHNTRLLLPSVGAAIGTAVHKAASHFLGARLAGLQEPGQVECADVAEVSLITALEPGAVWDATSPNMQTATAQVARMFHAYWPTLQRKRPAIVETELRATVLDGWELSGHVDYYGESEDLDDLKTGVKVATPIGQFGGYSLLLEAHGKEVRVAAMEFVPRVRISKPQPPPERTVYDVHTAKQEAWRAIYDIVRAMGEYADTGNQHALRANPKSMMCTEKYCPAWGTSFCTSHQKPKEKG